MVNKLIKIPAQKLDELLDDTPHLNTVLTYCSSIPNSSTASQTQLTLKLTWQQCKLRDYKRKAVQTFKYPLPMCAPVLKCFSLTCQCTKQDTLNWLPFYQLKTILLYDAMRMCLYILSICCKHKILRCDEFRCSRSYPQLSVRLAILLVTFSYRKILPDEGWIFDDSLEPSEEYLELRRWSKNT